MKKEKAPLIFEKIMAVMKDIKSIGKSQKNTSQNFMFRGIDDMYNAVHPLFQQHGIFIVSKMSNHVLIERTTEKNGQTSKLYHITLDADFTFYAVDGSSVTSQMKGEAIDYGDKGTNKAMSVALKYSLMQMFLIPTQELKTLDPDRTAHEIIPAPAVEKPNENAMTPEDKTQIQADLLLYETEKEVRDYAWQWDKYKNNLIFKSLFQARISQLKPENKMTAEDHKNYKRPKIKKENGAK